MTDFVFSADWHLSRLTWRHRPTLINDSFFSFEQIVDYCVAHDLPLLAGGDLFDVERPDPTAVHFLCRQLDKMQSRGLPVYFIQGQHERDRQPWLSVHAHPKHVDARRFSIHRINFYGLDWRPRGDIQQALQEVPADVHYLMCHQVWGEHMGDICAPEVSLDDLKHLPNTVVLTGDYHVTRPTYVNDHLRMLSPGSISMRNVAEPAEKYFYRISDTGSGPFVQPVQLRTRQFVSATAFTQADLTTLSQVCEDARNRMADILDGLPIVRVRFSVSGTGGSSVVRQACGPAHLFEEPVLDGISVIRGDEAPIGDEPISLEAVISAAIDDTELRDGLLRLLTSTASPAEVVAAELERYKQNLVAKGL
jgi:hypothetical protein